MKKLNNKGFTLLELMAVIVILLVIILLSVRNFVPSLEKNEKKSFVSEARVIAEAALNKRATDKMDKDYVDDLFYGISNSKACYTFKGSLVNYYVNKYSDKYDGSVEVCYGDDCTYDAKIWLTNGKYYIDGKISDGKLTIDDISDEFTTDDFDSCGLSASSIKTKYDYKFVKSEKRFFTPRDGVYALEAWGAQGGSFNQYTGGYGAYAYTEVELHKGDILYVRVGGKGEDVSGTTPAKGGWNDGADGVYTASSGATDGPQVTYAGGGGLTSIATKSGPISSPIPTNNIYIIAGGGATARYASYNVNACYSRNGYNAGGYIDESGCAQETTATIQCSFQCSNSTSYGNTKASYGKSSNNNGAGGGYYTNNDDNGYLRRSGGTSYVGNQITRNGVMYGVNVPETNEIGKKSVSTTNVAGEPTAGYGKEGNGHARITYIGTFTS